MDKQKQETPKKTYYPKIFWVSNYDDIKTACKRVVFTYKCARYLAWDSAETFEDADKTTKVAEWKYVWDLEDLHRISMDDIAKKFDVPKDKIVIVK